MAMITCSECGHSVSSLAATCPNCGAPIREMTKIKIHFHRKKNMMIGTAITGLIFIDGVRAGTGENGCSFDAMITPGVHAISTETSMNYYGTGGRGESKTINIPEDAKSVDVEIVLGSYHGTGFIKFGDIKIM